MVAQAPYLETEGKMSQENFPKCWEVGVPKMAMFAEVLRRKSEYVCDSGLME